MVLKTILKNLGLIFASSVLLYASWPPSNFGPIVFVALIPLLFYVDSIKTKSLRKKYFITFIGALISLFIFGLLAASNGWGDYNGQAFMAILMCFIPLSIIISFYGTFRNQKLGYLFLIFAWGTMELFQMHWEMNSPLLMIGNALSLFPSIIQHYSIWGVTGGTMYIVAVNIVLFLMTKKLIKKSIIKKEIRLLGILSLPIIISLIIFYMPDENVKKQKIGMTLAHFEHFTAENSSNPMLTIKRYNDIISKYNINDIDIMFFPESAVVNGGWIENLNHKNLHNPIDSLCPGKEIFLGSHVFSIYRNKGNEIPYYIEYDEGSKVNYAHHNCAIFRSYSGYYSVRSKDKYIPSHEVVPYPSLFLFTKNWFNKSNQPTFLSNYEKSVSKPFKTRNGAKIYPIMCFESTFSDIVVKQNTCDFIAILANESWNYQSKGKEQYFNYMTPKAIESGKGIIKVANGGYSGYINSKGQVIEKINYDKPQVKKINVEINATCSFYSRYFEEVNWLIILTTITLFIFKLFRNREVV